MTKTQEKRKVPNIRFPGFEGERSIFRVNDIVNRVKKPVTVEKNTIYEEIGIRSHGKGIFYKPSRIGESLGNKSVFWIVPDVFIVNIVFAWERAVARTTKNEIGKIASHRFPMYQPNAGITDLDFLVTFFRQSEASISWV